MMHAEVDTISKMTFNVYRSVPVLEPVHELGQKCNLLGFQELLPACGFSSKSMFPNQPVPLSVNESPPPPQSA